MITLAADADRTIGWVLVGTFGTMALVALVFGWLAFRTYRAYRGWWWHYELDDRPELRTLDPDDTIRIPRRRR